MEFLRKINLQKWFALTLSTSQFYAYKTLDSDKIVITPYTPKVVMADNHHLYYKIL